MGHLQLAFSKETASFWPELPVELRDAFEWPCPSGLWENPLGRGKGEYISWDEHKHLPYLVFLFLPSSLSSFCPLNQFSSVQSLSRMQLFATP